MANAQQKTRKREDYRLINADGHFVEPGDLFTTRVDKKFRDRAPRIEYVADKGGDGWILDGVAEPISFGMNACAGLPPEKQGAWCKFEEIRRGGYDPQARLDEMDADGVDAEVLYPTPRLSLAMFAQKDVELHLAMVRAWNDWMAEFVAYAPDRFAGLPVIPNHGVDMAVAEIERMLGKPGIRGFTLGCYPNGTLAPAPEDDAVYARLTEAGMSLNIHVAMSNVMPGVHKAALPGWGRFFDAPNRMVQMVFAGIFDRFPSLQVVFAETDCGWVPYVKEQVDNNYHRIVPTRPDIRLRGKPSEYFNRHFNFTYMTDTFGVRNRQDIGVKNMLWCSDYPHISADWPLSWKTIQASMSGVDPADQYEILCGNAMRLYGFGK